VAQLRLQLTRAGLYYVNGQPEAGRAGLPVSRSSTQRLRVCRGALAWGAGPAGGNPGPIDEAHWRNSGKGLVRRAPVGKTARVFQDHAPRCGRGERCCGLRIGAQTSLTWEPKGLE